MTDAYSKTTGINKKYKLDAHNHMDGFPQNNAKFEKKRQITTQYHLCELKHTYKKQH